MLLPKSLARRQPCFIFRLRHKRIFIATKLHALQNNIFLIQEKATPTDNADAYLRGLTNYCAKRCCFEAKLPYECSALNTDIFVLSIKSSVKHLDNFQAIPYRNQQQDEFYQCLCFHSRRVQSRTAVNQYR